MMKQVLFVMVCIAPYFLSAQTEEEKSKNSFKVSGSVDAYFQYGFKGGTAPTSFTAQNNSFALGMATAKFEKSFDKVGMVADLGWGPRAEIANGYGNSTLGVIKQLYMTYAPKENVKFTLGTFSTFVGYELTDAHLNQNYSMSYMFSYGPFFHTGLKADYVINDNWSAMLGVFNDTDTKIDDTNGVGHVGGQLAYSNGKFKGYLNYLGGKFGADSTTLTNNQIDVVATFQATEKLALGTNLSNKMYARKYVTDKTSWKSAAFYATYAAKENVSLAARVEYLMDEDGEIFAVQDDDILATTLSANFTIGSLRLTPELRVDRATKTIFTDKSAKSIKQVPAILFAAVYSF